MLRSLCNNAFESHRSYHRGYVVGKYQLGISEHFGLHAEKLLYLLVVLSHLHLELLRIAQRCQRVRISFGQELHTIGLDQFFHAVDKFRHTNFELLQGYPRYGKSHLELTIGIFNHFK